ncbi:hypothetical protein [Rhizorhabdus dicambivorans]|uniref:Uncharacterized protein n=1 Tax=Rhizorhabdus dicambivorans TaxID=1850238 RepID=A0A2A4FQQ3_9SPHN|nr:hypothetical protein [Rhizorhabdus dicambivorans]ATE63805.1 hypothetical protein CMV14_04870 [Rhizorhabdus dicambivorans]PCE40449.1 hypothetical protein COO09_20365 [Rhizorhabdus dicambivorans]
MTAYRALVRHALPLAVLLLAGTAARAAGEQVIALSPAEKAKLLDEVASRPARPDPGEPAINGLGGSRQVHGEVGMFVGTGGARGMFGSAVAPIGDSGSIAIAFENSRYGRLR